MDDIKSLTPGVTNGIGLSGPKLNIEVCAKPTSTARVSKIKEKVSLFLNELKEVCFPVYLPWTLYF